ncbi:hypothetical protein VNO80_08553 [Phaseolus coccineus]|uniref:N-acetyltransferase domain-containing protein n=1 Tax=Phaseolus coccineus TaxID=3886 RepID=A0AAN9R8Q9_PHACN
MLQSSLLAARKVNHTVPLIPTTILPTILCSSSSSIQISSLFSIDKLKLNNPMEKAEGKEECVDLAQISLRPLQLSDLDDLLVWTSDEKVATFCTWDPYTSKDDGINFIQNIATKFVWCRAICLNDRAIGCVSLSSNSEHDKSRNRSVELGYVVGSKYWGKGVVTLVVKQVVKAAFTELPLPNLERVEALVDVLNVGSQRVLEKAGFQREGILRKYVFLKGKSRDMVMFSVLSTDSHLPFP